MDVSIDVRFGRISQRSLLGAFRRRRFGRYGTDDVDTADGFLHAGLFDGGIGFGFPGGAVFVLPAERKNGNSKKSANQEMKDEWTARLDSIEREEGNVNQSIHQSDA